MKAGAFGRGPGKWRLDETAQRFAAEWQAGRRPSIEQHLDTADTKSRPELLRELLAVEARLRREQGELVRSDDYAQRFPELPAAEIEQLLESASIPAERSETLMPVDETPNECDSADVLAADAFEEVSHSAASVEPPPSASSSSPPASASKVNVVSLPVEEIPPYVPPVEPSPVESIGRYRIGRCLGSGSFGEVLEATDPELDRKVALKLPRKERKLARDAVERFRAEGRVLARLRHPGLVAVYDAGVTVDGRPYVVSELIEGEDLSARLAREGKLSVAESTRMVAEAAEALATAHIAGVVHRDVKPANLMLDRDDNVRVADFGIALPADEQEAARGEVLGSPAYMSPEQFTGEAHLLDGRADIWALGVVLYELLTGRRPFTSQTFEGLQEEVLRRDPRPLRQLNPKLPAWIDDVVSKCLAKRAADRYDTAADLAADLRRGEAGFAERRRGLRQGGLIAGAASLGLAGVLIAAASIVDIHWPWKANEQEQQASNAGLVPGFNESIDRSTVGVRPTPPDVAAVDSLGPETIEPNRIEPAPTVSESNTPGSNESRPASPTPGDTETVVATIPSPIIEPPVVPLVATRPSSLPEWLPARTWPTADAVRMPLADSGDGYGWSRIVKPVTRADGTTIEIPFRLIPHENLNDPPAFYMMETKVWNHLFAEFFSGASPGALGDSEWFNAIVPHEGEDWDRFPVVKVRLRDASRFASWVGGKLPTAKEWDKAAGFYDHSPDAKGPFLAADVDSLDIAINTDNVHPVPVGSAKHDVSPYGIRDMAGNGWEYTRTQVLVTEELPASIDDWDKFVQVMLRGRSYAQDGPLTYENWNFSYQGDVVHHWTSFRVVLEQE